MRLSPLNMQKINVPNVNVILHRVKCFLLQGGRNSSSNICHKAATERYNLGSLTSANTALPELAPAAVSSFSQENTFLTLRMCIFFTVCCRTWVYVKELLCTGMISWNGTKVCYQVLQVPQVPALHNLENVAGGTCDNPQAAPSLINQIDPIAQKSEETVQLKELPSRDGGGRGWMLQIIQGMIATVVKMVSVVNPVLFVKFQHSQVQALLYNKGSTNNLQPVLGLRCTCVIFYNKWGQSYLEQWMFLMIENQVLL